MLSKELLGESWALCCDQGVENKKIFPQTKPVSEEKGARGFVGFSPYLTLITVKYLWRDLRGYWCW